MGVVAGGRETERIDLPADLAAYLELVRVPNLFTAPPDVILGAALLAAAGYSISSTALVGLVLASVALYAGGTALNDAADAPIDVVERPERPIPSGRVDRGVATGLGLFALVVGVTLAWAVAGAIAGLLAIAIAVGSLLYDGLLSGTFLGAPTMGGLRALNVLLGAAAAGTVFLGPTVIAVLLAIWVYVAGVTSMADHETVHGARAPVTVAMVGLGFALLALLGVLAVTTPGPLQVAAAVVIAGGAVWIAGRPLRRAREQPEPETIGPAVGACILALVVLDAAFATIAGLEWALAILVFLVPAVVLSAYVDSS